MIYERYYAACKPLSCTYSISDRANLLFIISAIIGLFGGLSVLLKLITLFTVSIGQRCIMHRRQRIQPTISIIIKPE